MVPLELRYIVHILNGYCSVVPYTFATPWTIACQVPLSMGFPRQFPRHSHNSGVGYHFLLQGIFATQLMNPRLLHWQADSLPMSHQGSPHVPNNRRK